MEIDTHNMLSTLSYLVYLYLLINFLFIFFREKFFLSVIIFYRSHMQDCFIYLEEKFFSVFFVLVIGAFYFEEIQGFWRFFPMIFPNFPFSGK